MNKTVFAYALNEIDDDLICKYAPGSFESVVYAHNKKKIRSTKNLLQLAACLGIAVICTFFGLRSIQRSNRYLGDDNINSGTSAPDDGDGENQCFPSTFFNSTDHTSLLKIKPLRCYGSVNKFISMTSDN